MTHHQTTVAEWRGRELVGNDGDTIGTIDEVYVDATTEQPEWLSVKTGMLGSKVSFVPIAQAQEADEAIRVPYEKAHVKDAPSIEPDGELSHEEESGLYRHYGLEYADRQSGSGLPEDGRTSGRAEGHDTSGPTTDDAMTRSEEELRVGTQRREAGRARLRKYVVTEQVQQTVPVQREEVRVEREPITDANADQASDGPAISEEEHEVVLQHERPVVEKRAVPKERVRLSTDEVTEEAQVSEEVRKEQIETDGTEEGR
jgi:uncharacterized protein (TIGR02271 family)